MNSILDHDLILKGKKVIVRVDLNVPMKDGVITEVSRIMKILPTLKLLIQKEAKIIILSHIGRPKGKVVNGMTLEPVSKKLSSFLNSEVLFNKNKINESEQKQHKQTFDMVMKKDRLQNLILAKSLIVKL